MAKLMQQLNVLVLTADIRAAWYSDDGFARNGFKIRLTGDPVAALQAVGDDPPDVVIVDFAVPGLDGIALARAFGGALNGGKTPFLLIAVNVHGTDARGRDAAGIHLSLCGNTAGLLVGVLRRFRDFLGDLNDRRDGTESEREFSVPVYR